MFPSWLFEQVHMLGGHPTVAAAVVLLLAGSESAPIVGAVVPGTAAILAIATLVSADAWTAVLVTSAGALGAMLGDCASFTFGQFHADWIQEKARSGRFAAMIDRSNQFFARHGGKSVFLARFLPGVRAVVPMVAGATCMPPQRFYPPSIASAAAWACSHILPVALLAASAGSGHAKVFIVVAIGIAAALLAAHAVNRLSRPAGGSAQVISSGLNQQQFATLRKSKDYDRYR